METRVRPLQLDLTWSQPGPQPHENFLERITPRMLIYSSSRRVDPIELARRHRWPVLIESVRLVRFVPAADEDWDGLAAVGVRGGVYDDSDMD